MRKFIILLLAAVTTFAAISCSQGRPAQTDLSQLDYEIAHRPEYMEAKKAHLDSLKAVYDNSEDTAERFEVLGQLFYEYLSYDADSALHFSTLRQQMAQETGNEWDIVNADLNMAEYLGITGHYLEALEIAERVDPAAIPDYLRPYLFHILRTVYGLLCDSSVRENDREKYRRLTDCYRDSIISVNENNPMVHTIVMADRLNVHGQPAEAVALIKDYLSTQDPATHDVAILAFTLANSYRRLGDIENEKKQLIRSSIHDMRSAVKEYIALRELALLLYKEGDVKHAYKYLTLCMRDAQECNARQRIVEINDIFPVVNEVYLDTIDHQRANLKQALWIVLVLVIFLIFAIYLVLRQMHKVSMARRDVEEMNGRLQQLNNELRESNERLVDANQLIAENSALKEEYIGRYMGQCLIYIDRLDTYRKSLNKLALAGRLDELKKQTKSVVYIDNELKAFYDNFDSTFLHLFPTFVADFNRLLRPEEQIQPKSEGGLNTELRIFALIRLGIGDSVKIANFLRYSVTTIYNYRTRVRNKAIDRETLETELMTIGRTPTPDDTETAQKSSANGSDDL